MTALKTDIPADAPAMHGHTKEKILDAAEALIIENGYAGTSLRAITSRAEVNLAAAHYHFGSKKGLFAAVFHRRMGPIGEARLQALAKLENSDGPLSVKAILRAFLDPLYCADRTDMLETLPSLVGRIYGEPDSLTKPMLQQEFAEVASRYLVALAGVLPQLPEEELHWRFHFMIGSMIQLLRFRSPLVTTLPGDAADETEAGTPPASQDQFIKGLDRLIDFTAAGLQQSDNSTTRTAV